MIIKREINTIREFQAWSQAKVMIAEVIEYGKEAELMELIEEVFDGSCTDSELNDFLWHETAYIYERLNIPYN